VAVYLNPTFAQFAQFASDCSYPAYWEYSRRRISMVGPHWSIPCNIWRVGPQNERHRRLLSRLHCL